MLIDPLTEAPMHRLRPSRTSPATKALVLCAHLVVWGVGCDGRTVGADTRASAAASATVVDEARTFMDAYARDLLAGDRTAIAARYDRTGAYFLGNGRKEFTTYDSVVAQYRGAAWNPPVSFEWRDLSFEPVGPDAVVVAGQFVWVAAAGAPPMTLSYTSLLRRQDGALRIRLEDESFDPASLPPRPVGDSTRK
jgi:hypothetical protein